MIRRYSVGYDVELHKRTLESGLLSLIGPLAEELVTRAGVTLGPVEHDHVELLFGGVTVRAIRTDLASTCCSRARIWSRAGRRTRGGRRRGRRGRRSNACASSTGDRATDLTSMTR